MAEPKLEELTDGSTQASGGEKANNTSAYKKSASISSWVPIIMLLVFLPLLSFLMTEYLLLPRIKLAIEKTIKANVGSAQNNATIKEESVAKSSGETKEGKPEENKLLTYEIKEIVANITGPMQNRYVRVSFVLEGTDANFVQLMKSNEAKLIDATLSVLSLLTMEDLAQAGVKNLVRSQLLQSFETVMRSKIIQNIYFSQFVIQ